MDSTAASVCMDVEFLSCFQPDEVRNVKRVVLGEDIGTEIRGE